MSNCSLLFGIPLQDFDQVGIHLNPYTRLNFIPQLTRYVHSKFVAQLNIYF